MTSIIIQKNINHNLIKNENIINHANRTSINAEYLNIMNNEKDNKEVENDSNKIEENKLDNSINEDNLENKTVDEVYNFINDNKKEIKSKKKKRTKKKKNKKSENEIKALNENINSSKENEDDIIFQKFKEDIEKDVIDANEINKVKAMVSDNWIKRISNY